MARRDIKSKKRYFFAFLIATVVFIMGFVVVFTISYFEFLRISSFQSQISYEIFQDKLKYSFFDEEICNSSSFTEISADLGFQGRIIDDLERKLGKNDERVLFRKKFYTLIELEHFEFVNTINKECKSGIPTILFFYSNDDKDVKRSEEVGELLSVAYRRNPEIIIYSFDINLDSEIITALKKKYEIEESPTIIINGKSKIVNPENIDKIEKFL